MSKLILFVAYKCKFIEKKTLTNKNRRLRLTFYHTRKCTFAPTHFLNYHKIFLFRHRKYVKPNNSILWYFLTVHSYPSSLKLKLFSTLNNQGRRTSQKIFFSSGTLVLKFNQFFFHNGLGSHVFCLLIITQLSPLSSRACSMTHTHELLNCTYRC